MTSIETWIARQKAKKTLKLYSLDGLRMPKCWMHGPRWKQRFDVREQLLSDVSPTSAGYHQIGKKVLTFTFEDDLRELMFQEIRPGVLADWSCPWEQLGLERPER